MEPDPKVHSVKKLWSMVCQVLYLVGNDDSTMQAVLKHKGHRKSDKGGLSEDIDQTSFLADLTHRVRTIIRHFYRLVTTGKTKTKCTKVDCMRLKRNYGWAIKIIVDLHLRISIYLCWRVSTTISTSIIIVAFGVGIENLRTWNCFVYTNTET